MNAEAYAVVPAERPGQLAAALLLGCIGVMAIMAGPVLTEQLVTVLGLSPAQAGQVFAAEALGTALGPVAAAFWMPRVRWRTAAIAAVLAVASGNALSSVQTDTGALTALRFAVGFLGEGTAFALSIALISGTRHKDRNFAFLIAAQVTLGVLCFLLLPLPGDAGIPGVLLPLAGLALVTLATVGFIEQPAPVPGAPATAAGGTGGGLAVLGLLAMLIWCTGLGAIWAFVKLIGAEAGIDPAQVGMALAFSTGIAIVGALFASWLADRAGRILPVTVALLMQIAMMVLLRGEMGFLRFAVTAATFQIFWNITGPYMMGTIATADTTGRLSLLIPTAQIGGFFLGPVLAGAFLTGQGYEPANAVAIVCFVVALAVFVPVAGRVRASPSMR